MRIIVFLLLTASLHAVPGTDSLWSKAVEAAGRAKGWVPGSAVFRMELTDDKGVPTKESQETWYRLSADADGEVVTEVVRSVKNGKDNTKDDRETQEKRNREGKKGGPAQAFSMGDNPLDPEVQDKVEASAGSGSRSIAGISCVPYEFVMKTKAGRVRGTAWLSRDTGVPLEISMVQDPLPAFVQKMTIIMRYDPEPGGEGRATEAMVEGSGGVLFLRRNFRVTFNMGGWWRLPTSRPSTG